MTFQHLTNRYKLSKTIRFELRPIGKTSENIKKVGMIDANWEDGNNKVFGEDYDRSENSKIVKMMLDEIHRKFIQDALSFSEEEKKKFENFDEFYQLWKGLKNDFKKSKEYIDKFSKKQLEMAEALGEIFKDRANKWSKLYEIKYKTNKEMEIFLSEKISGILGSFLKKGNIEIEKKGKEDEFYKKDKLIEIFDSFKGFWTYFKKFHKNRENVYQTKKLISTSIAHRIFKRNAKIHFSNIEKWNSVKEKLQQEDSDFKKKCDEIFKPSNFVEFFSQDGIDKYNEIVGGGKQFQGDRKEQGINERINQLRQKSKEKLPFIKPLQKQILSKDDRIFIEEFKSDKEMLTGVKNFAEKTLEEKNNIGNNIIDELVQEIDSHFSYIDSNQLKEHYLSKSQMRHISNEIFSEWDTLDVWREKYTESIKGKKLNKTELKKLENDGISYHEVHGIFSFIKNQHEAEIKKEWKERNVNNIVIEYIKNELIALTKNEEYQRGDESFFGVNRTWEELKEYLEKGEVNKKSIKKFLDSCNNLRRFVVQLSPKKLPKEKNQNTQWQDILESFLENFLVTGVYNKTRNYITKRNRATKKIKINFQNSTLLDGWSESKEKDNWSVILKKDDQFYLGIMAKGSNKIFDNINYAKESGKSFYEKMNYNYISDSNKMFHKKFFSKKRESVYNPCERIRNIRSQGLYKNGIDELYEYISFMKECILKTADWMESFNITEEFFKPIEEYTSFEHFCKDFDKKLYKIRFKKIPKEFIDEKVASGKLYLFQIYNKDFSLNKKGRGRDNLHTMYWKGLFEKENLSKTEINLRLNGSAEIFFRPASIKYSDEEKKIGHHCKELKDKFKYPILKDRRFSENKYLFHVPITLNFGKGKEEVKDKEFNKRVNKIIKEGSFEHIVGIDRGERNLLYYSVINKNGDIIEEGSLNKIKRDHPKLEDKDYHEVLEKKEEERDRARKDWKGIERIKDLKAGYLSQVIHEIAKLVVKYKAIIVLEELNIEFKRGRFKFEKQVYQKFEKALIDKFNYLVFKDANHGTPGHYSQGYQLAAPFESFEKLKKQSGIIFYATASYTSKTDPVTGFFKNVYYKYTTLSDAKEFWKNFDSIKFQKDKDWFEFTYTLGKVKSRISSGENIVNQWTVCSCVERSRWNRRNKKHEPFNPNSKIKEIFEKHNIPYQNGDDLIGHIVNNDKSEFHKELVYCFSMILEIRVVSEEKDSIQSPVEPFFNSDNLKENAKLPCGGDSNGAYNIARKGIIILENINKSPDIDKFRLKPVSKNEWANYVQSSEISSYQNKKYQNKE